MMPAENFFPKRLITPSNTIACVLLLTNHI